MLFIFVKYGIFDLVFIFKAHTSCKLIEIQVGQGFQMIPVIHDLVSRVNTHRINLT